MSKIKMKGKKDHSLKIAMKILCLIIFPVQLNSGVFLLAALQYG